MKKEVELTEEIIVDILVRLPVKSLVRFRCVSKYWLSLLTNPNFVQTHLKRIQSQAKNGLPMPSRVVLSQYADTLLSIDPENHDSQEAMKLGFPLVRYLPYYVKGHCDGLLCLVINDGHNHKGLVILYNPSIREYTKLPIPKKFRSTREVIGFGYDPTIEDYKLVRVPSNYCRRKVRGYVPQVEILNLKSKTWRKIPDHDNPSHFVEHFRQATYANGGLYWLAEEDDYRVVILRFDLITEKFSVLGPPCDDFNWSVSWVGSLNDSLCVLHDFTRRMIDVDIWITKDDKNWTKLITIPRSPMPNPSETSLRSRYMPVCFTQTGELLLCVREEGFMTYNPKDKSFRQVKVTGAEHFMQETVCRETLVPPTIGSENEQAATRDEPASSRSLWHLVLGLKRGMSLNNGRKGQR